MKPYKSYCTSITILPEGESIFFEAATRVEIIDEGGGAFIRIQQINDHVEKGEIRIDVREDWNLIKEAVEALGKTCDELNKYADTKK